MNYREMADWLFAPGEAYFKQAPKAPTNTGSPLGNALLSLHNAIDPVNTMGGYGGTVGAVFAGPGARTANMPALSMAKGLEESGYPRADILNKTGWFRGADKKWRFEIPDTKSSFRGGALENMPTGPEVIDSAGALENNMGTLFDHPDLYAAYPELKNLTLIKEKDSSPAHGVNYGKVIGLKNRGYYDTHPTLLHELQHTIQDIEGFARGSNTDIAGPSIFKALTDKAYSGPNIDKEAGILSSKVGKLDPYKLYKHMAGEAESRNVANRFRYSNSLGKQAPWETLDIPEQSQIPIGVKR